MIRILGMILVVALCFVAAILNLAAKFRWYRLFTRIALVLTALIGAACYGYGFVYTTGFTVLALFRALLAMCRMFAGINDFSAVYDCC